ncbi:MAG TPA: Ig-like domain-containing protein, partial [Candidatus Limnocylindria bacterium]|nr:Ig-like domain-containing protein [Candidatus Limnocylindria bacterium]
MGRRSLTAVVTVALLLVGIPLSRAVAVSPDVVISQVYGGGGNSGATLKNDFIELYNRGTADVSLSGWSVQYGSATGTTWAVTALSGTIAAGGYYLIKEAAGAGGTVDLPTPDATGSIAMGSTAGKVALVTQTTALTCAADCDSAVGVRDFVGYGAANDSETSPAPTLSNTTAALRAAGGATDTDNNAADFTAGSPNPRNSGDQAPRVSSTTPAAGAAAVALDSNVTITFSEAVSVGASWYTISCSVSGSHAATASGGPTVFTLDPTTDFMSSETCTVTVFAAEVADADANDPPDNMSANHVFSFSTIAPPTAIRAIQGAGHISPLAGTLVLNVPGIVTARSGNGFWIQDPSPDTDPATSEGIFVFTGSAPAVTVGDSVSAKGTVTEFRPGGSTTINLTTTELANPGVGVTVLSSGNALPATTVIGVDRTPPTEVIEDDATGSVETSGVFDPATDGIDFWESLEGMRVQLNDARATGPRNSFGEISLVVGDAGVRTARGGIVIRQNDFNPERLIIDDVLRSTPSANTGDTLAGATIGVLDYSFGNFKLLVTQVGSVVSAGIARESTTAAAPGQLAMATFNVENLDPSDGAAKFDALAA